MMFLVFVLLWDSSFFVYDMVQLGFALQDGVAWRIAFYAAAATLMFVFFLIAASSLVRTR